MAYFRNRAVNLLNLHYGIHSLALTGSGAFYTVFLLKAGLPLPDVLASLATILMGRFLMRPLLLPLALRFGLKPILIAGTLVSALQYPVLATVHGIGPSLYLLIGVSAVGDSLYWTSYHAVFASLGDAHQRGQQVGVREAMAAMIGIAAPLLAGWALTRFGAQIAFGATALVLLSAAAPLLWTPNIRPKRRAPKALRAALPGILLFACDGWIACGLYFGWQLALFVTLGENFQSYGGAMAVAALAGAIGGLVLGRLIDDGHGRRAAFIALGVLATVTLVRAASIGDPGFAVFANALGALVSCLYVPTLMTVVYNKSQSSPCVARFHIAAEGGWDIGGSTALITAALLVHAGEGLRTVILLSLPGVMASFVLLYRHYGVRVSGKSSPQAATAPLAERAEV